MGNIKHLMNEDFFCGQNPLQAAASSQLKTLRLRSDTTELAGIVPRFRSFMRFYKNFPEYFVYFLPG